MRHALKFLAGVIMVGASVASGLSSLNLIDHKGREAAAIEKAAKASPYDLIGTQITTSFELREAEADEAAARVAADHDAITVGLAVICLLLAAGTWLLAEISGNLRGPLAKADATVA